MKHLLALLTAAIVFLLISCNKTDISQPNDENRLSGVLRDDPEKVASIPIIISQEYLDEMNGVPAFASKGSTKNDRTPPYVSITSPANGATVTGTVSISVSASDNIGVSQVSLFIDGLLLSAKTSAPFVFSWNTAGAAGGAHSIKAMAKDAAGNSSSYSISLIIPSTISDITPPAISITSPGDGSSFVSGNTVSVSTSASDNIGIASVSFSVDGVVVVSDNTSPYGFSWNTTGISSGTHSLSATARDAAGNFSTKNISISITAPLSTAVPSSFSLLMPPVQNQGGEGICAVFATVYAARSAEKYYSAGSSVYSYSANIFSPEFVYNQIKAGDCGSGTGVTTSLDFLQSSGVCTWQSMPYSSYNGCNTLPTSAQTAEAASFKISGYSRIISSDISAIKSAVFNKHPVIITVGPDQSFRDATAGFIWRTLGPQTADHALVICGWDDSKHAYRVYNSWGTGWGDSGFSWIDYDLFPQAAFYYSYIIN